MASGTVMQPVAWRAAIGGAHDVALPDEADTLKLVTAEIRISPEASLARNGATNVAA